MIHKITYLSALGLILLFSFTLIQQTAVGEKVQLLTTQNQFEAGNTIILSFSNANNPLPNLYCSNSYGSIIINAVIKDNMLQYEIPSALSNKSGLVNWKLLSKDAELTGAFEIYSKQQVGAMETYLGPPSIEAGGTDYSMLVVIPTDDLDNPLKDSTQVLVKHQFLVSEKIDSVATNNLIAFKTIYSQSKTGRILISSECLEVNSKEYALNVMAAIPENFSIFAKRHHDYADGNQVTSFSTSQLKDAYSNFVSDGTYVDFFITNKQGNILKTSGTTIGGIATAEIIHPDHEDYWVVKAFVEGMAESNDIQLNYKQVIKDFEVSFSKNNRTITIGPLQSFMKQLVPDGLHVGLLVYKNNTLVKTLSKSSRKGFVTYKLKSDIFPNDTYRIKVITAGQEKNFQSTKLW